MTRAVRFRCTLIGRPPGAPDGVLGWEVRWVEAGNERLVGMYFAHRDRVHGSTTSHGPMPDIKRVVWTGDNPRI